MISLTYLIFDTMDDALIRFNSVIFISSMGGFKGVKWRVGCVLGEACCLHVLLGNEQLIAQIHGHTYLNLDPSPPRNDSIR